MRLAVLVILALLYTTKGYSMTYDQIIAEPKSVVRFTARWCPPCKALAPIFDEVAAEHPEVKTFVVDADENPEILQKFGVRGIPTVMKIEAGAVTLQRSGAMPKEELEPFFK